LVDEEREWVGRPYLSWLKTDVRRGMIRGAASVTVITEKRRREKSSSNGNRRLSVELDRASVKLHV